METIKLSPLGLNPCNPVRRTIPRPPHLRQPDYEDRFDFLTVFYDCFRSVDEAWCVLIGPPLLNLEPIVLPAVPTLFRCRSSSDVRVSSHALAKFQHNPSAQLWLRTPESRAELPPGVFGQSELIIQPNQCDLFLGRKVLLTQSKNNELHWIRDWVYFFARKHGADAVLLYDNASTKYETSAIYETISSVPGIEVAVVVHWPYKYGPPGSERAHGLKGMPWDSNYSQLGILEHARHRFLSRADAVVNADVDELVLTKNNASVFELLSRSDTGYLRYTGHWIESVAELSGKDRHHSDFFYRSVQAEVSPPKWTMAPRRCPPGAHWLPHGVPGMRARCALALSIISAFSSD